VEEKFTDQLPTSIKQLPKFVCLTGMVYMTGLFIAFIVLLALSVQSNMNVQYIR
jgi:hypothetical protein